MIGIGISPYLNIGGMVEQIIEKILNDAAEWSSASDLIPIAGKPQANWGAPDVSGWSHTMIVPRYACRRKGVIKQVVVRTMNNPQNCKLKVFRWNSSTSLYDFISESILPLTIVSGVETVTLPTPLSVEYADVIGIYSPTGYQIAVRWGANESVYQRIVNADVLSSNDFSATSTDGCFFAQCYANRPYLAIVGDSILAGLNEYPVSPWCAPDNSITGLRSIPGGKITCEPAYTAAKMIGSDLIYENFSVSGVKFDWGASNGIVKAIASKPKIVIVALGANDIIASTSWSTILISLNSIKASVDAYGLAKMFVSEILPQTAAGDAYSAQLRLVNTNLANWCINNNIKLISCHDAMGQVRISTNEIDDIKTEYNYDGVHLSEAGAIKLGQIYGDFLIKNIL